MGSVTLERASFWPDTKLELHKKEPTKLELQKNELTKLELHKLEPMQKRTLWFWA